VASVATAAAAAGKPVAVCGEAAADPVAGPILVGLGVTELSVAPGSVSGVRARFATLTRDDCRAAAEAALSGRTLADVRELANQHLA
jgi:phosphotransferase system enzyme I (PtsI)